MIYFTGQEKYRATLYLDYPANTLVYTAVTEADDKFIYSLSMDESNAINTGNPVGVISPNSLNIEIVDVRGLLITSNTDSPYYAYMRNGVKVKLEVCRNTKDWVPLGVYYTESWTSTLTTSGQKAASIYCVDALSFIGNIEIAGIDSTTGTTGKAFLESIFEKVKNTRLTDLEYVVNPAFNIPISFPIVKGARLRDVLNTAAQSMVARISMDRSGVLQVQDALYDPGSAYDTIDNADIKDLDIKNNSKMVYNKVRLNYNSLNSSVSDVLAVKENVSINGANSVAVAGGLKKTTLANIQFDTPILSIDGVYAEVGANASNYDSFITQINFTAGHSGITIDIYAPSTTAEFLAIVTVEGVPAGSTNNSVEAVVTNQNQLTANTLELESYLIQDDDSAQQYVERVATYLNNMRQELVVHGTMSALHATGDHVRLNTGNSLIDGHYMITDFSFSWGSGYSSVANMVKMG